MNTLHPVFQQALAPFVQAPARKPRKSTKTFHYTLCDVDLVCELDYERASGDGWNEPRYEASVSVLRVYLNGCWCDAADVASGDQITKWEVDIMEGGDE